MKRIVVLLGIILLATGSFGAYTFFPNEVVEFKSGEEPENVNGMKHFQQNIYWNDNGNVMSLEWAQENDFSWVAQLTGDLEVPVGCGTYLSEDTAGKVYKLNNSHVYFTGSQGTIKVTETNPNFNGQQYSCSYTILYHLQATSGGKRWDFNSTPYQIRGSWDGNETHMSTNPQSQVYHKYNGYLNNTDGSEAVAEAAGLKFTASQGSFGGNNPSASDADGGRRGRFICFKAGASFTIPASYYQGLTYPKIRIKMTRFGDNMDLTVTNGLDALGNYISGSGTYSIGGSEWIKSGSEWNYHGEYHFQPADKNQDFTIKVQNGQYLMLFTVEVYDSYEMKTENQVLGTNYALLNHEGASAGQAANYNLHFYGKGERCKIGENTVSTTGTVTCNESSFVNTGDNLHYRYTSNVGEFGTFRMRIECYTHHGTYCTDYAWRTMSVGYMQEHAYPYTWDFADIKPFIGGENRMDREDYYDLSAFNVETGYTYKDYMPARRNLWQNYGVRISPDYAHNFLYCGGSQLWCGKEIIPETQYLAFEPANYEGSCNGALSLQDDGLHINHHLNNINWWCWIITVPSVPTNGVVYVRAHKIEEAGDRFRMGYIYGRNLNPNVSTIKNDVESFSSDPNVTGAREIAVTNDGSGDVIYVVPAPPQQDRVLLFINGLIVKKIAVATDEKKVNEKGYASESRNHDIDAMLLPYFTGEDFKTYVVSNPDYDKLTLTLTDVGGSEDNHVMKAYTGCIIRRVGTDDNLKFNIFNDDKGFHLFVPDMHDMADGHNSKYVAAEVKAVNDKFMVPVLSEKQVPNTNTDNYVRLVYNGFDVNDAVWYAYTWDNQGDTWIPEANGMFTGLKSKVIFVRMNPNGNVSWDNRWNQIEDLTPQNGKTYTVTGWNNGNGNLAGYWSDSDQAIDMTNYVLTYNYKKLNGTNLSATISGEEKFYRVYSGWDIWLRANSAYLQLPTESVLTDDAPRSARMFTFLFDNSDEQAVTGIDNIEGLEGPGTNAAPVDVNNKNAVWYNIYGQRVDGRPAQRGVYIVNGKKVTVK